MGALQIFMLLCGCAALVVTVWAIWSIVKTPDLQKKPLWIIGSLFAFVGFSINWTSPENLYFWIGVRIPFFSIFTFVGSGQWLVQIGCPIIAVVALMKTYQIRRAENQDGRTDVSCGPTNTI